MNMNNLVVLGTGIAAYKVASAHTGKTDKMGEPGVLSDLLTTNGTSDVMSKLCGCLNRFASEEVYNNRGFSALFGQTGETRKANLCRYLITHDKANITGELTAESKKKLLGQAQKAVQYSRQAEHLFGQISQSNNQPELELLRQAKTHCEDLLYLYAKRDDQNKLALEKTSQSTPEKIASLSQIQEELHIINGRIEKAELAFKDALNAHLNLKGNELSKVGYQEFMGKFQLSEKKCDSKYSVEDFIRFYAFQVSLTNNEGNFKQQVYADFRHYIIFSSVGCLDAGAKLSHQYGRLIADLMDESSLGDVDSRSGNLSKYFLQTVFNLLNAGEENFSLDVLCIGASDQSRTIGVPEYGGLTACPGSYYLKPEGNDIAKELYDYFRTLSSIVSNSDSSKRLLPELTPSRTKNLSCNWLGGTHSEWNITKKGLFFRIDELLKGHTSKTESEMHSKLVGFDNNNSFLGKNSLDEFVNQLPKNSYPMGGYVYALAPNDPHTGRLNMLQRIGVRCQLNDLGFPDRQDSTKQHQLRRLKSNFEQIIANLDDGSKKLYTDYFKEIIGADSYDNNFATLVPLENFDGIDEVLTSAQDAVMPNLAGECIRSAKERKEMVSKQKFNLNLTNDYDVDSHLNTYSNTIKGLRKKLETSSQFKDMKDVITMLHQWDDVSKFYNNIINNIREGKEVGLLATPTKLATLAKVAVLDTKEQVNRLYTRYKELDAKYSTNDTSLHSQNFLECESEIFEYSFLETLFDFINVKSNTEKPGQLNNAVDIILNGAVSNCIKKLGSMQYITLATDTIRALNSKRQLLNLTKQKEVLVQFAQVFSIASTDQKSAEDLQRFSDDMDRVIVDLETKYRKLAEANGNGNELDEFAKICSKINAWLLKRFINQGPTGTDIELQYDQKILINLPQNIAKSCQESYRKLQAVDFSDEGWGTVSYVHKTLMENMLDTNSSLVSKLALYLGQLFSDGFTYNPETEKLGDFQNLLASYEKAVSGNLNTLNMMGYMHQELLGQYNNLIGGVRQLFAFNTTIALRSKLTMALLDYNSQADPQAEFICDNLTNNEKKLYLNLLNHSNLFKHARKNGDQVPAMSLDENGELDMTNFELHSPNVFADPTQVVKQILGYLNMTDAEAVDPNTPLTNYVISTTEMAKEVKLKSEQLHLEFDKNKDALKMLKAAINHVSTRRAGDEKLEVSQDTIISCNELIHYFKEEAESAKNSAQSIDGIHVNVTKINTLYLADVYKDLFNNLFKPSKSSDWETYTKIKIAFENAYREIGNNALHCDIALFENISQTEVSTIQRNSVLEQEIVQALTICTKNKNMATIGQPLDFKTLEKVYDLCSKDKDERQKKIIRIFLNVFQYKKIEQYLAKFYVSASNNLPKLATNLNLLYQLVGGLNPEQTTFVEPKSHINKMEDFIIKSNEHLYGVTDSIMGWKKLISDHAEQAWLVQPRNKSLEDDYKAYFDWFTVTYLKLDLLNSGVTGPARDELQFLIILDYLKVYKNVGVNQIKPEDIELIKRFYHSPNLVSKNELTQILEALMRIDTFLTDSKNDEHSLIKALFSRLSEFWQQIVDWFIRKEDGLELQSVKRDLQNLYDLFYLEIITKANTTLDKIRDESTELDKSKTTFEELTKKTSLTPLLSQFKEVNTGGELYQVFRKNAEYFTEIEKEDSNILNLIIDAIKFIKPQVHSIRAADITFIKDIIEGKYGSAEYESAEDLEYAARQAKVTQVNDETEGLLGSGFTFVHSTSGLYGRAFL